eukprot:31487-Pelagococcus_subviridis.AAC.13
MSSASVGEKDSGSPHGPISTPVSLHTLRFGGGAFETVAVLPFFPFLPPPAVLRRFAFLASLAFSRMISASVSSSEQSASAAARFSSSHRVAASRRALVSFSISTASASSVAADGCRAYHRSSARGSSTGALTAYDGGVPDVISPAPGGGDGSVPRLRNTNASAVTDFPSPGSSAKTPPRTSAYIDGGRGPAWNAPGKYAPSFMSTVSTHASYGGPSAALVFEFASSPRRCATTRRSPGCGTSFPHPPASRATSARSASR